MPNEQNNSKEPEIVEIEPSQGLGSISKAEIDMQITTAHKFPRFTSRRGVEQFQREILTLATVDEETARSMFYKLKRKTREGKIVFIEGPTVRMAEIVASCWRNLHSAARHTVEDDFVTGQAFGWDLETNYRVGVETRRRITTKYGERYSEDMITTTANAAMAIAFRNAIFKVVPGALIKKALVQAKETALGKGLTIIQRRERAFKLMATIGAKPDDILRVLGRRSLEDVTVDDLTDLNGLYTAIQDSETTWQQILHDLPKSEAEMEEQIKRDFKGPFETSAETIVDDRPTGSHAGGERASTQQGPPPPSNAAPRAGGAEDPTIGTDEQQAIIDSYRSRFPKEWLARLSQSLFDFSNLGDVSELKTSQLSAFLAHSEKVA